MKNLIKLAKATLNDALPCEDWQELLDEPVYEEYVTINPNGRWSLVQIADDGASFTSYIYFDRDTMTHRKTTISLGYYKAEV